MVATEIGTPSLRAVVLGVAHINAWCRIPGYGEELTSSVRYLDIDFRIGTAAQHETVAWSVTNVEL